MAEFGTLLREMRTAAGMSLGALATRTNYSKGQVSKIENGLKKPSADFAKLCDDILSTGGVLSAALRVDPPRVEKAPPEDLWVLELDEDGSLRYTEVPRRALLAGAGAAALLSFAAPRTVVPVVDDQSFALLRGSFDQLRALGTMMSPRRVFAQVVPLLHTVRALARESAHPTCSELLVLAARIAEFAGWMSQEKGDEAEALRWTERAVALVADHDPHMASFGLFRQAEMALYRKDPVRTIELARMAQRDQAAGPRILGLAARCEAQGFAQLGDVTGYEDALERAATLLATREQDTQPVLGPASVPDDLTLVRGWSLYDLGKPREAAALLDQQLPGIPGTARRARARFGVRRALAHALDREIDQACQAAREVLADVTLVDSATVRIDLLALIQTLNRWRNHPGVQDLRGELVPLMR